MGVGAVTDIPRGRTHLVDSRVLALVAGGAAGNHTLTGIEVGDKLLSVIHLAASSVAQAGVAAGTHTVSAGEDTAGTLDIVTGLGASLAAYQLMVLSAGGVHVPLDDAAISEAAGTITVADGGATFAVTDTDVIHWIASSAAPGGALGTPEDLTSEFSVTAANTINNTGGTATTGGVLLVDYFDADLALTAAAELV